MQALVNESKIRMILPVKQDPKWAKSEKKTLTRKNARNHENDFTIDVKTDRVMSRFLDTGQEKMFL